MDGDDDTSERQSPSRHPGMKPSRRSMSSSVSCSGSQTNQHMIDATIYLSVKHSETHTRTRTSDASSACQASSTIWMDREPHQHSKRSPSTLESGRFGFHGRQQRLVHAPQPSVPSRSRSRRSRSRASLACSESQDTVRSLQTDRRRCISPLEAHSAAPTTRTQAGASGVRPLGRAVCPGADRLRICPRRSPVACSGHSNTRVSRDVAGRATVQWLSRPRVRSDGRSYVH